MTEYRFLETTSRFLGKASGNIKRKVKRGYYNLRKLVSIWIFQFVNKPLLWLLKIVLLDF